MKILLVEDDHRISSVIKKGLEQEGFLVDVAFNGESGLDMALSDGYDVLVLDLMLPLLDGMTVCRQLREKKNQTPILMLTAKSEVSDKVAGLTIGADDYLAKPFAFEELLARIKALSRRGRSQKTQVLTIDNLVLNTTTFEVNRAGMPIELSKKEFLLLEFLLKNKHRTVSKKTIITKVWEFDTDVLPNTVEVYIGYLRNKIDKPFKKSKMLIKTVRGFGYKISDK
ncbi:MAG: DNA-binding response regulator [Patescibacteria group bacterium]|nr:MAG: DNA-binding response regulator [Patescibacteria group bacterium]